MSTAVILDFEGPVASKLFNCHLRLFDLLDFLTSTKRSWFLSPTNTWTLCNTHHFFIIVPHWLDMFEHEKFLRIVRVSKFHLIISYGLRHHSVNKIWKHDLHVNLVVGTYRYELFSNASANPAFNSDDIFNENLFVV